MMIISKFLLLDSEALLHLDELEGRIYFDFYNNEQQKKEKEMVGHIVYGFEYG